MFCVSLFFPWWPKKPHKGKWRRQLAAAPPGVAGVCGFDACLLRPEEGGGYLGEGCRKGVGCSCLSGQAFSQPGPHRLRVGPRVLSRCLWESQGCRRGRGASACLVPGKGSPLLLGCFCLSWMIPCVQAKGRSALCSLDATGLLFSWCYSQFLLGSTEVAV